MSTIIQSLWIGNELSVIEKLTVASFIKNGHPFHLYTYQDVTNLPEGVLLKDANQIIPETEIFTYSGGSYAGFSNWFRWELLNRYGNYWVDMDVVCLKPFDFEEDLVFGQEFDDWIGSAILKFPKNHTVTQFLANVCRNPHQILPYDSEEKQSIKRQRQTQGNERSNIQWGETGPKGLTAALGHFGLANLRKPKSHFYPIQFNEWKQIFDETFSDGPQRFTETYALHLWNEMMRRDGQFNKNDTFPKNSLIEQLKQLYL